jgi:hypothetical protein
MSKLTTFTAAAFLLCCHFAFAQLRIVGSIAGSVHDPSGAVIPGAKIELKDEGTGIAREITATNEGTFMFPDLAHGLYAVTVTAQGFQQAAVTHIQVIASQTTDVPVVMKIGAANESVVVEGVAPVLETTSNLTNSTQTTKLVSELPTLSRTPGLDFAQLVPGYTANRINNVAGGAMNVTLDGINNASNGWKSGGTVWYNTVPIRLGALEEVSVESGGLGADSGAESGVNVKLITKRGTNQYHGSVFYQPTSEQFNANTWLRNAQGLGYRAFSRVHNFGGNVGGRLVPFGYMKDKLFFFLNYEYVWTPSFSTPTTSVLTPAAMNGTYTYLVYGTTNQTASVNVLTLAAAAGYSTKLDPIVQSYMTLNNQITKYGTQVATTDLNRTSWLWNQTNRQYQYYPTARVDYYVTPQHQVSFTWNYRHSWQPGTPRFPMPDSKYVYPFRLGYFVWAGALQSSFGSNTFNEFRYGTQHSGDTNTQATSNYQMYNVYNNQPLRIAGTNTAASLLPSNTTANVLPFGSLVPYVDDRPNTTGRHFITTMYDTVTRVQGQHTIRAGFNFRRTDWKDVSEVYPLSSYTLGTPTADPMPGNIFTAQTVPGAAPGDLPGGPAALYNQLVGRVASAYYNVVVDPTTKQYGGSIFYNWFRSYMGGLWVQDSWRLSPRLTVNLGLRWEAQGDQYDVMGMSGVPDLKDIYGPSTALFKPGNLTGYNDPVATIGRHPYKPDWNNVAPNIGVAWNPDISEGFLGRVMGGTKTAFRGSYGLSYYDEGTLMTSGYYNCGPGLGIGCNAGKSMNQTLQAGTSASLPQWTTLSDVAAAPLTRSVYTALSAPYQPVLHQSQQTFLSSFAGMKPNLSAPYIIQWNIGIQRELARNFVIEVRYAGNQSHRQWRTYDLNETNIFENSFLTEFQRAQNNLAIANGMSLAQLVAQPAPTLKTNNFSNQGMAGQMDLPILTAAFGPRGTVPAIAASSGFNSATFAGYLQNGAAGSFAGTLTGQNYFCRMMGNSFAPCLRAGIAPTGQSFDASGAAYPINFFRLNPYTTTMNYVDDAGWWDYNGLQTQLRKTYSRGLTWTLNYTWSHGMSNTGADDPMLNQNWATMRNKTLDRRPSPFDMRHTLSTFMSYELPVGKGKWLHVSRPWLDHLAGGWTVSSVFTVNTGQPVRLGGNYNTYNTFAPTGVNLAPGVSLQQLSDMFHGQNLQKINGVGGSDPRLNRGTNTNDWSRLGVPLNLIASDGRASQQYIVWNTTPGSIGQLLYIAGKNNFNWNLAVMKNFSISERLKFQLYADAQNVLNHPYWGMPSTSTYSTSFGTLGNPTGNRTMTFRGLFSF